MKLFHYLPVLLLQFQDIQTLSCLETETDEPKDWNKLQVTWQASPEQMLLGDSGMNPAWTLLLFGNGSPTQNLALLTGSMTQVDVIQMVEIGNISDSAPLGIENIAMPRTRRQVWLRNEHEILGYAVSWINVNDVNTVFRNPHIPIGTNIMQSKTELFRDMKSVFCGNSVELEKTFQIPGPYWGRYYFFWKGGRALTLIYEVFSPALEQHMGKVLISGSAACPDH